MSDVGRNRFIAPYILCRDACRSCQNLSSFMRTTPSHRGDQPSASIVVARDIGGATQALISAVTAANGVVAPQIPGQPIGFTIKSKGLDMGCVGTAHLADGGVGQTRIDAETHGSGGWAAFWVVVLILNVFGFGYMLVPVAFLPFQWVFLLLFLAGWIFMGYEQFFAHPQAGLDRFLVGLAPFVAQTAPAAPTPSVSATEQLKQLGELHASGILTDSEFAAKKAELLKRI